VVRFLRPPPALFCLATASRLHQRTHCALPADTSFLTRLLSYLTGRILSCTKHCIICDAPLKFEMLKPAVCDSPLCLHSHEQYGLGEDVAATIRSQPELVDFLVSTAVAAAQGDVRRFQPLSVGRRDQGAWRRPGAPDPELPPSRQQGQGRCSGGASLLSPLPSLPSPPLPLRAWWSLSPLLCAVQLKMLTLMPAIKDLAQMTDTRTLKHQLDTVDPLVFPLLRWILTSNRAHLVRLDPRDHIKRWRRRTSFVLLSSPPERAAVSRRSRKDHPSFWASMARDLVRGLRALLVSWLLVA